MRIVNCVSMHEACRIFTEDSEYPPALVPARFTNGKHIGYTAIFGPLFVNRDAAKDFIDRHGDPERSYYLLPANTVVL